MSESKLPTEIYCWAPNDYRKKIYLSKSSLKGALKTSGWSGGRIYESQVFEDWGWQDVTDRFLDENGRLKK